MDNSSATLIQELKKANNILVALSAQPSVDQLATAIGLTLILTNTNPHVTTIFSGQVPEVLRFLRPDEVFDQTVDSLRDFIISLDPEKADYVKTKIVDGMVRVSITPNKTAVTVDDLEFSQGDYNVDFVLALGVKNQADLDQALQAHGRILHNATVASVCVGSDTSELGNINWSNPAYQSYAQAVAELSLGLEPRTDDNGNPVVDNLVNGAVATALMTALVSKTARFSNSSTTPEIMSLASVLMTQGANQQLIVKQLESPVVKAEAVESAPVETKSSIDSDLNLQDVKAKTETDGVKVESKDQTELSVEAIAEAKLDQIISNVPTSATLEVEAAKESDQATTQLTEEAGELDTAEKTNQVETETAQPQPSTSKAKLSDDDVWNKVNKFKQDFLKRTKTKVIKTDEQESTGSESEVKSDSAKTKIKTTLKKKTEKVIEPLNKTKADDTNIAQQIDQALGNDSAVAMPQPIPSAETPISAPLESSVSAEQFADAIETRSLPPVPDLSLEPAVSSEVTLSSPEPVLQSVVDDAPDLPDIMPPLPPAFDPVTITSAAPMTQAEEPEFKDMFAYLDEEPSVPMPSAPMPPTFDPSMLPPTPPTFDPSLMPNLPPLPPMPGVPVVGPQPAPVAPPKPVDQSQFVIPE